MQQFPPFPYDELCYAHKAAQDLIAGLDDLGHQARFALAVLCYDVHRVLDAAMGWGDPDPDQLRSHGAIEQVLYAVLRYPDVVERFERENEESGARERDA